MACMHCIGKVHTRKPFRVITQSGASVDVVFNHCPVCGRKLKSDNPAQDAHRRLVEVAHNKQASYGDLAVAIEEAIVYLSEALNAKGDKPCQE